MSKEFEELVLKKLEKLDVLDERTSNTDKNVREIKRDFAVFDFEINRKIDTLFDAISVNNEKHVSYEENIVSLNSKVFNHDIRISNLEDKVLTA